MSRLWDHQDVSGCIIRRFSDRKKGKYPVVLPAAVLRCMVADSSDVLSYNGTHGVRTTLQRIGMVRGSLIVAFWNL